MLFNPTSGQAQEELIVGFVKSVSGKWYQSKYPAKFLIAGSPVLAGQRLHAKRTNGKGDEITIWLLNNKEITSVCSGKGKCNPPLLLPMAVERQPLAVVKGARPAQLAKSKEESVFTRFSRALTRYLDNVPIYRPLISRGGIRVQEGVAEIAEDQINLNEVFIGVPYGQYYLTLSKVKKTDGKISLMTPLNLTYNWDPAHPAPIKTKGIEPGLYSLAVRLTRNEVPTEVWILISSRERYRINKAAFEEAERFTDVWDPEVFRNTRSILRAYLDYLSEQGL
jgi:hypothetical protein